MYNNNSSRLKFLSLVSLGIDEGIMRTEQGPETSQNSPMRIKSVGSRFTAITFYNK